MPNPPRLRRFTIWHAALLLPWFIATYGFRRPFNDNSYLWHVRAGDLQLEQGAVLTSDPFSFTMAGESWRTQSWLAELFYSRLDDVGGLTVAPLITSICAVLIFILLGLVAYRRTGSMLSVVVYLVATAIVCAGFLNPRPVIFSFPLFAAMVVADEDPRLRWSLPVIMWIWASMHGSFIIGLGYLLLRALGRRVTLRRLVELVIIGVPTLMTAHGLGVLEMLLAFARNRDAVDIMSEWQTPDLLSPPFVPVFLAFLAVMWIAHKDKLQRGDWLLIVPFFALAVSANRAVPPAWIALAPVVSRLRLPIRTASRGGVPAVLLAVILGVGPLLLPREGDLDRERFPVDAAAHIQEERVFHDDGAGGWLIYQQWPERKVYVDDRAELYGEQLRTFSRVRGTTKGWRSEFDKWGIEEALVSTEGALAEELRSDGWTEAYGDEEFAVLRSGERN